MKLSTVILPIDRWPKSKEKWQRAEQLGFHAAYTYDHLSWGRLENRPWFGAVPTLVAASTVTSTLKIGTLVTSPNFRHPVPAAKELMSIDDISDGRLIVGIGSGGTGNDAHVLGLPAWDPLERADRFEEFVAVLDELLHSPVTTRAGQFYTAHEMRMLPGPLQVPRPPFYIAASGPRGMDLTARFGQGWVTLESNDESQSAHDRARRQVDALRHALAQHGRVDDDIECVVLSGFGSEQPLASVDAFVDWAGRYGALGITEVVVHWPEPDSLFDADMRVFERIALDGWSQLRGGT